MKISCIIPTRDRSEMTCRAIASAMNQDVAVGEIVVVDDGSVDNTVQIIGRKFPEVRLVQLEGRGPGPARHAGVAASSGDILMFLDSDDEWLPDHAARLFDLYTKGVEVAYGTTRTLDRESGTDFLIPDQGQGYEGDCLAPLANWCFMVPSSFSVSRAAYCEVGGFADCAVAEDWDLFLRLAKRFPFGFSGPAPISNRYLHPECICNNVGLGEIRQIVETVERTLLKIAVDAELMARAQLRSEWTCSQAAGWQSIQEWYLALKKEDLV